MKIAVPVTADNFVDSHFGHCGSYGVYTIDEKNEITGFQKIQSPQGCGCKSDIASVLAADGVSVMLAGGIGAGAINVLNNSGIQVVRGCQGKADELVRLYANGMVTDSGSSCSHHDQHHSQGHNCSHN